MLHRFHHAAIAVRELDAAVDVYTRLLGSAPSWRGAEDGVQIAAFPLANARIELHAPQSEAPALREHLDQRGEGLYAIAFATRDAAAAAVALAERGLGPLPRDSRSGAARREPPPIPSATPGRIDLRRAQVRGIRMRIVEERDEDAALPGAPAQPGSVQRLDHVVVRTAAPEASIRLYRDQLGIRLALDRSFEERRVRLVFFRIAGVTVELAASLARAEDSEQPDVLSGLAYGVDDLAAAQARVAAAGFDVSEVRQGNKPGTRVCTVRSPTHAVPTLLIGPDPDGAAS